MTKTFVSLFMIFSISQSFAETSGDIVQLVIEGTSRADSMAKAQPEAVREALQKGSLQIISQLIGSAKLEKNSHLIRAKVLTQTSKYVLFYKGGEPVPKEGEITVPVTMKISISSLQDVLSQEGLLFQTEGPATILPMIKITDKRDDGKKFTWWTEEAQTHNAFLRDQLKVALQILDQGFRNKNFYLIDPVSQHYVQWLPVPYMRDHVSLEDIGFFGSFYKAQILLLGEAVFEPGGVGMKAQVKVTAYNINNGRVVGEMNRNLESPSTDWDVTVQQTMKRVFSDLTPDLVLQIADTWNRGIFSASLARLNVRGVTHYKDLENLKRQVLLKVPFIRSLKERLQQKNAHTFEMDVTESVSSIAKKLETSEYEGFKLSVSSVGSGEIDIRWSKVE